MLRFILMFIELAGEAAMLDTLQSGVAISSFNLFCTARDSCSEAIFQCMTALIDILTPS